VVLAGRGERLEGVSGVLPWLEPALDGEHDPFLRSLHAGDLERFRLHFLSMGNYRKARRAIRLHAPDVVWYFNLALVSLAPVLAARHAGTATLGYVADPWPTNHWVRGWRENEALARAKPERLGLLERAWRAFRETVGLGPICVCSDYLRRELVADGLRAQDMEIVAPNLYPEMEALTRGAKAKPRNALEPLRVVCTSSFWEGKGQMALLEGLARARAAGESIELVVAGGGDPSYREELERRAARPDLAGAVRFAGRLGLEELSREMFRAAVLVMPSIWGEPFGLATIEGMAHGLAVVASDAGASPELVDDGVDGLVTRAGDPASIAEALARLAGDEELRLRLARRGLERVADRYTRDVFAAQLERALVRAGGEGAR